MSEVSKASQEFNGLNGVIESLPVKMEIDGHPYYIKSKGNVPYIYDIDTNNEVGYWSSKRGGYVMFSLYNQIMKQKYDNNAESNEEEKEEEKENGNVILSDSESELAEDEDDEESDDEDEDDDESDDEDEDDEESDDEDEESDEEESEDEKHEERLKQTTSTYSLMFAFLMFFIYLTLQREFQTIYFDFMFLILINLLNTLQVFEMLKLNN
jgi:hypothetical protein